MTVVGETQLSLGNCLRSDSGDSRPCLSSRNKTFQIISLSNSIATPLAVRVSQPLQFGFSRLREGEIWEYKQSFEEVSEEDHDYKFA